MALYRAAAGIQQDGRVLNQETSTRRRDARRLAVGIVIPALAAVLAVIVNAAAPLLSAILVALVIGAVVANVRWPSDRVGVALASAEKLAKTMLRLGIVLLGLKMSLTDLAVIGWRGLALVVLTVAVTFVATLWLGRRLGLESSLTTLMAAGFSICGAAAIASVSQAIRAKGREVGIAVGLVTIFGTVMIAAVPALAHLLALSEHEAGLWAGASIHEVAQVVAAGSFLGAAGLAAATTVKLARVVLLAPVTAIVQRQHQQQGRRFSVPWYVVGFVAAVLLRTVLEPPVAVLDGAAFASNLLLAAGMFGLGLTIRVRDLWPLPGRAVVLATASTLIAAVVPLAVLLLT